MDEYNIVRGLAAPVTTARTNHKTVIERACRWMDIFYKYLSLLVISYENSRECGCTPSGGKHSDRNWVIEGSGQTAGSVSPRKFTELIPPAISYLSARIKRVGERGWAKVSTIGAKRVGNEWSDRLAAAKTPPSATFPPSPPLQAGVKSLYVTLQARTQLPAKYRTGWHT